MTFLRVLLLVLLAAILVLVALANRAIVTLRPFPDPVADLVGANPSVSMPLFVALFLGIAAGLVIGYVIEWLREHRFRSEAARERARREKAERELARTRADTSERDEVLQIVEGTR